MLAPPPAEHMAGRSAKATAVKGLVRELFKKNATLTDPEEIEKQRNCAMQGLANYLTVESLSRLKRKGAGGPPVSMNAIAMAEEAANMNSHANAMYGETSVDIDALKPKK